MNDESIKELAQDLQLNEGLVVRVLELLAAGNTVHFLARYRKEQIGGLDETRIREIEKLYKYHDQLSARKAQIKEKIAEQGLLSKELNSAIDACTKLVQLEQLYAPYKSKKITKAKAALEGGLEPLARRILNQQRDLHLRAEAAQYINETFVNEDEVLENTMYLVAQIMSESVKFRTQLKALFERRGQLVTKAKKDVAELDEKKVYENYYEFTQNVNRLANHQVLAINRAEKAKVLQVKLVVPDELMLTGGQKLFVAPYASSEVKMFMQDALKDAYKRLLFPSISREIRSDLSEKAQRDAIILFGDNVYQLFMQQPLVKQTVLGFDPAFRTGCKLAVINGNGDVEAIDVIYPHAPQSKVQEAHAILNKLHKKYDFTVVAIGNGTASRESEAFIAQWIKAEQKDIQYALVNEAGASVYSASKGAQAEFPMYSLELRSAVSIARRLLDPCAELVKIDPKALGVGQYQHDLNEGALDEALTDVVDQAVNTVGVDLNIASTELLTYISGLNKTVAQNIVDYRKIHGNYHSRAALKAVKGIGTKVFEQAAGFLRILNGEDAFDNTNLHPESYAVAERVLSALALEKRDIGTVVAKEQVETLGATLQAADFNVDKYTFKQILDTFADPLRDERADFAAPQLKSNVTTLEDLSVGMELEGVVRNITDFGAFIDIGLKNDGFVHISKMANRFIKHPSLVLRIGEQRKVYIENIYLDKGKVELTLIERKNS
jgi:uncharacterized protein